MPARTIDIDQWVAEIRDFFRDYPELNRLITGHETSDRMIKWATVDAMDEFNDTPPPLSPVYDLNGFPSRHLLRLLTIKWVLRSSAMLQARNQLSYSDGGITVAVSDKAPIYSQIMQQINSEALPLLDSTKRMLNVQEGLDAWHGMHSDYYFIAALYGDF